MEDKETRTRADKQTAGKIVVQNRFVKWLDNFWYHHKWGVIIGGIFLFAIIVCAVQCAGRELSDVYVTFAGGFEMSTEERQVVENILSDLSEDQEDPVKIGTVSYTYFSEDELRALFTDDENGFQNEGYNRAKQSNAERFSNLNDYIMTGECSLWFVSEAVYAELNMQERLAVPLRLSFDAIPESAYDDCAIRLIDTEFYRYYREQLDFLPADTLLVLTNPNAVWGASSDEEHYDQVKQIYRAIVQFKVPS